jgi:hypothetical protein
MPGLLAAAQDSCTVSGRVVDDKLKPVAGAAVTALRAEAIAGVSVGGDVADARGRYCIGQLPPGRYFIRASAPSAPPSASPSCESCCRAAPVLDATFHPAAASRNKAKLIAVPASGADIAMRRAPGWCVRGQVRDETGRLRGDVALSLRSDVSSAGLINEGGRFLLTSLPSGLYTLVAADQPKIGRVLAERVILVRGNMEGVVITVPAPSLSPHAPLR